jgi:hypothetical protein
MLKYNLERLFMLRGISKPASVLIKAGFPRGVAYRILENKIKTFTPSHIEKLCIAFDCTPNELMEWTPDSKYKLAETHPLQKLLPEEKIIDLREITKDIPIEKLGLFADKLEELKRTL